MDMLRSAALSACAVGIVISLISGLSTSEKMKRPMNIIYSLSLVLVIINCFKDIDKPSFSGSEYDYTAEFDDDIYISLMDDEVKKNICAALAEKLTDNGIISSEITVNTNISDDGSISIINASAAIADRENIEAAAAVLSEALGISKENVTIELSDKEADYGSE